MQVENISQAVGILIEAVEAAQRVGAFTLQDAKLIAEAVDYIKLNSSKKQEENKEAEILPIN